MSADLDARLAKLAMKRRWVNIAEEDLDWLNRQYLSPLNGLRDVAASLVREWGYDPAEHPALMDALEMACWEAFSDTAHEVMREHGLKGPADDTRSAP